MKNTPRQYILSSEKEDGSPATEKKTLRPMMTKEPAYADNVPITTHSRSIQPFMSTLFNTLPSFAQHELLHNLLLNLNDAVIIINEQRLIIVFNQAAEVIFNCPEALALNQPIEQFIPQRYHAQHEKHVGKFHQEGLTKRGIGGGMQLYGLRRTGEEFPVEVSVTRSKVQGQWFSIAVIRDVSERESYRQKIEDLNKTLEGRIAERTQHLIRLNQEKNEFLAMAAHDLRNPLTGITASAELIDLYMRREQMDKLRPEKLQQITADILEAASRMTMLLEEMLDVGKIEFGAKSLASSMVESDLIDQMCDAYNGRASVKNITLQFHQKPDVPLAFWGDSHAVLRVLDNLLSNAVKYSPIGSQVWVDTSRQERDGQVFVRVSVRDSGPGIDEQDREKLFRKFTRLSAQPTAGESSTGLGLWIVKQLVTAMNGAIWCESTVNQGATFHVEFSACS